MSEAIRIKVKEYADMKKMANELADMMAALECEIKAAMGDTEEMSVDGIKVKWTHYTTSRFDTTSFRKANPELAAQYTKSQQERRFQVVA